MDKILLGKSDEQVFLNTNMLNRHGIIAGATGTGKTVTLKVIAEQLSDMGVPVFMSDVKGDLSSIMKPGVPGDKITERIEKIGIEGFEFKGYPVEFFDVFGEEGTQLRSTITEMGPVMLARLLGLNDVQTGVLNIAYKLADENGLLLFDTKDLRSVLNFVSDNATELSKTYGNISKQSVGSILRSLLVLEQQGGDEFFGEPAFNVNDFLRTDESGNGIINILSSKKLMNSPQLYSTFLFWLLSELYENMPEVGDLEKPKIVFFFDEAHLLFTKDAAILLEKIELIARLIRSKGVGVFFITQNPTDIPDSISSQLGNRIQHGLRAYSPKELKAVKMISETLRSDGTMDVSDAITNLSVGEAVISVLDPKGIPTYAKKTLICPPKSDFGIASPADIQYALNHSQISEKYSQKIDSYSAYEALADLRQPAQQQTPQKQAPQPTQQQEQPSVVGSILGSILGTGGGSRKTDSPFDRLAKNVMSSVGRELGRQITRGIFGNTKK